MSGTPVSTYQDLVLEDLENLTFEPESDWFGLTHFTWQGFDGKEYSSNSAEVKIILGQKNICQNDSSNGHSND